jgi:peptidyl-tRNA hydrolase
LKAPQQLLEELEQKGYISIRDKGFTELPPSTLTCCTLGIMTKEEAADIVENLKLL